MVSIRGDDSRIVPTATSPVVDAEGVGSSAVERAEDNAAKSHGRRPWQIIVAIVTGTVGIAVLSISRSALVGAWAADVLINAGTALLLFTPLLIAGRVFEKRIRGIEQSQGVVQSKQDQTDQRVAVLAEDVSDAVGEIRSIRDQLAEDVADRLAEQHAQDLEEFSRVRNNPSPESVGSALREAFEQKLVFHMGPRVRLQATEVCCRFPITGTKQNRFSLAVETRDGTHLEMLWVDAETGIQERLVELARRLQQRNLYPGDAFFTPMQIFDDLAELLSIAYRRRTGAGGVSEPIWPVIELFPPQWALTEYGIERVDLMSVYQIASSRLDEIDWEEHILGKPWVDRTSFLMALATARDMRDAGNLPPVSLGQ